MFFLLFDVSSLLLCVFGFYYITGLSGLQGFGGKLGWGFACSAPLRRAGACSRRWGIGIRFRHGLEKPRWVYGIRPLCGLSPSPCRRSASYRRSAASDRTPRHSALGFFGDLFRSHRTEKTDPEGRSVLWLRNRDSNPNKQSQSLPCCRYTIPQ